MMAHTCPNCGNLCGSSAKLSEWERAELLSRASAVLAQHPVRRNKWDHGRYSQLRALSGEYGINLRTLYRYLREAA